MNGYTLEDGVVFLQLQTLGGVLAVFGGDVARGSGKSALFHFGALEDDLHSIAFSFFSSHIVVNGFLLLVVIRLP